MFPLGKTIGLLYAALAPRDYTTAAPAVGVDPHTAQLDATSNLVAATLAAPGADMVGRPLRVRVTNADNTVTIAFTTVEGATTLTLALGDDFVLFGATATQWAFLCFPASILGVTTAGKLALSGAPANTYTQTYSTANRTVAAPTAATLTDNGGGTADGTVASQAAPTTLTDSTGLDGTHDDTLAASAAPTTLTDSTGFSGTHDDTLAAVTVKRGGHARFTAPDAAGTTNAADQLDLNGVAEPSNMANVVQPDYPRNVVITVTDADVSIDAFQIDVTGFAPDGSAASEQFVFAGGLVQTGSVIFSRVTNITLTSINGNGAADTLDAGYGVKFGLPVPAPTADIVIEKLCVDGAREDPSATDQTNNSFTATTAPNATVSFDVFFSYTDPIANALAQNQSDIAQKVIELVTLAGVMAQNDSDLAQKVIELVTLAGTAQNNLKECTTQINALVADDLDNRQTITAIIDDNQTLGLVS